MKADKQSNIIVIKTCEKVTDTDWGFFFSSAIDLVAVWLKL